MKFPPFHPTEAAFIPFEVPKNAWNPITCYEVFFGYFNTEMRSIEMQKCPGIEGRPLALRQRSGDLLTAKGVYFDRRLRRLENRTMEEVVW